MKHEHKAAFAAIDQNGSLSAALEALKERISKEMVNTLPPEKIKREDLYMQYQLVGKLKEVIKAAINDADKEVE